jgi:hypothetical protein
MKTTILLLFTLSVYLLGATCFSQQVYFNKLIDNGNLLGIGITATSADTSYTLCSLVGPGKKIGIHSLNLFGDVNWLKKYGENGVPYYIGRPGSFINTSNNTYALGGSKSIIENDSIKGYFAEFSETGDSISFIFYDNQINNSLIIEQCKETKDHGFVFAGENYVGGLDGDVIILRTDAEGNELWRNLFGWSTYERGYSIIQTPDKGFIIGGYSYAPGVIFTGDPILVKFDSLGNYQWNKVLGGQFPDEEAMVCLAADGNCVVLTAEADSLYTPYTAYSRINVIKMDQDGNILWDKKYGKSRIANSISNIKALPDGGFICCGSVFLRDTASSAGWMMRLDADGDSLWYRTYMHYTDYSTSNNNQLYDVALAHDGGFIATGQAYKQSTIQKIWVLKVDSLGCDTPGCSIGVGIEIPPSLVPRTPYLHIFPNPASEILHFKHQISDIRYQISIYDLYGRKQDEIIIPPGQEQTRIDVSSYPSGVYIAVLKNSSGIVARGKFVKK